MHRLLWGIKRRVVDLLNLDRMSEKYHVLSLNYLFLMLYTTLESVFVNTLLYTIHSDISIVIFYRGITYVASAVTMHAAAYLSQRRSPIASIRAGAFFYLATYLLLFFGMDNMQVLMIPVAILSGTGGAFYWTGHNLLVSHYSTKHNRDVGIAILGIIQGVMTLVVPVVSGFVISLMPGTTGYRIMFGVGMAAVVVQLFEQRRLAPVEQKKHVSQAKLAFKLLRRKLSFKYMMGYEYFRGFRDGAFAFLLNMVLFEIITNESLVGINTFLTGIAAITGSWVYGRFVQPSMRPKIALLATTVLTVFSLTLAVSMSVGTVMLFSLVNSFVTLFIIYSVNNSTYDVLGQNETTRRCMSEMLAIREGAIAFGRMSGLAVLMVFPHNQKGYVGAILVLTASQFIGSLLIALTQRLLDRKRWVVQPVAAAAAEAKEPDA